MRFDNVQKFLMIQNCSAIALRYRFLLLDRLLESVDGNVMMRNLILNAARIAKNLRVNKSIHFSLG